MWTVVGLTFRKFKEPAFFLMLAFALMTGYAVSEMDPVSDQVAGNAILSHLLGQQPGSEPVLTSTFAALLISMLLSCFTGAVEIPREISSGQIQHWLSKPISRTAYLLGKYFGILLICSVFFCTTEVSVILSHYINSGTCYSLPLIARQFLMMTMFIPYTAVILMFSCCAGDIAAIIFTLLYILFSLLFNLVPILIAMLPKGFAGEVEESIFILYYLFPNNLYYLLDIPLFGIVSAMLIIYSLSIASIFLLAADYQFRHMDLSKKG